MSETNKPTHDAAPGTGPAALADRAVVIGEVIERLETRARQAPAPGARLHSFRDVARVLIAELHAMADEAQPKPEPPRRGDAFEQWLRAQRDQFGHKGPIWVELDNVLNQYRLHADTGTPLGEHVCEAQAAGDCDCLKQPFATESAEGVQW